MNHVIGQDWYVRTMLKGYHQTGPCRYERDEPQEDGTVLRWLAEFDPEEDRWVHSYHRVLPKKHLYAVSIMALRSAAPGYRVVDHTFRHYARVIAATSQEGAIGEALAFAKERCAVPGDEYWRFDVVVDEVTDAHLAQMQEMQVNAWEY